MSLLPNTRQLLTSLVNTLTTTTTSPQHSNLVNEPYSGLSNPLKNLPQSQRALLTTLHVLFPPPMLLQALDLLDRGLITRLVEKTINMGEENSAGQEAGEESRQAVFPPQANIHLPPVPRPSNAEAPSFGGKDDSKGERNSVYQVRSSQPPKSRFRDSAAATGSNIYTVRLEAWNCSCAAFAYSAYPGGESSGRPWGLDDEEEGEGLYELRGVGGVGREEEKEGDQWQFGGLSADGHDGKGVPVCKHLVACLLGERLNLLQGYVKEKQVSRDEMGGVGGEG
jgi:hypothetical protein